MKIALCLSGHIRNLEENYLSLKNNLLNFYDVDVFIHTWDTYGWRVDGIDITTQEDGFKGFDYYSGNINQIKINEILKPKKMVIDNYKDFESIFVEKSKSYTNLRCPDKDRPSNMASMWYKIMKCNELKKHYEEENNFKYDIVIRTRPDLVYFAPIIDENILLLYKKAVIVPIVESHGFASDLMAVGSSKIIDIASNVYEHLDEINKSNCLMNPHNILEFYYNKFFSNRIYKHDFKLYFNRCRKKCGTLVCNSCHPLNTMLSNKQNNLEL